MLADKGQHFLEGLLQILAAIAAGGREGMVSMEEAILKLYCAGALRRTPLRITATIRRPSPNGWKIRAKTAPNMCVPNKKTLRGRQ